MLALRLVAPSSLRSSRFGSLCTVCSVTSTRAARIVASVEWSLDENEDEGIRNALYARARAYDVTSRGQVVGSFNFYSPGMNQ